MGKRIPRLRAIAFHQQNGRCYYCGLHTWLNDPASFARRFGISHKLAEVFRCTAEHLKPREDGGADTQENIVAACWRCNSRRHQRKRAPSPEAHKRRIQARLKSKRWHEAAIHASGLASSTG